MFLEAKGYVINENKFYQDNKSAMRLETNGRKSCGQKSRHIDIRHFFIKDRIASGDIILEHCPTEEMLADFFIKPLQGSPFKKFRAVIMGHTHISTLKGTPVAPSQERVGVCEKAGNKRPGTSGVKLTEHSL